MLMEMSPDLEKKEVYAARAAAREELSRNILRPPPASRLPLPVRVRPVWAGALWLADVAGRVVGMRVGHGGLRRGALLVRLLFINVAFLQKKVDRGFFFGNNHRLRPKKRKFLPSGSIASGLWCGRRDQD